MNYAGFARCVDWANLPACVGGDAEFALGLGSVPSGFCNKSVSSLPMAVSCGACNLIRVRDPGVTALSGRTIDRRLGGCVQVEEKDLVVSQRAYGS